MNLIKHTFGIALLTGLGLVATTGTAQAYSHRHIDNLALRLQKEVENMHDEVHAHFRPTPIYRHLDADVAEMERLARHIHDVAHHRGSIRHIRHDVEKLDRLYHHIEDLIRSMRYTYRLDPRTSRHFFLAMSQISRTLHHLRDDLRVLDYHSHDPHHGHTPHLRVAPRGGIGISVGRPGRGISFRLRLGH